jgi:hypothetical protein
MAAGVDDEVIVAHCCEAFESPNFVGKIMESLDDCV